jgi:hypothetical protein
MKEFLRGNLGIVKTYNILKARRCSTKGISKYLYLRGGILNV